MHASEVTPEVARTANELYWGSDRSVNQIAEELDLSKGALYGVIAPDVSGLGCPLCGAEVGFANRTAKERGLLDCPACSWDGSVDETVPYGNGQSHGRRTGPSLLAEEPHPQPRAARATPSEDGSEAITDRPATRLPRLPPLMTPRLNAITKGALIGATVGLALVVWARRR